MPIKVKHNKCFTISLESTPSTGYSWAAEYDASAIELPHEPEFKLKSTAFGGGGVESFNFCAKKKGETILRMKYQRPWEKVPVETREFRIQIK
jgi:predicted secreted protein